MKSGQIIPIILCISLVLFGACTGSPSPAPQGNGKGVTGIVEFSYTNGRIRCSSRAVEPNKFEGSCRAVVLTDQGQELTPEALAFGTILRWLEPIVSAGASIASSYCNIAADGFSQTCLVTLSSDVPATITFGAQVKDTSTGQEKTEAQSIATVPWLGTKQIGVIGATTSANHVTSDASRNVYITGRTNGGLDGNSLSGTEDVFVTKYDGGGVKQWTKQLGVPGRTTIGYSVAADPSGNVYVTGDTTGGLDGNALSGSRDFFITKYDSGGSKLWTRQLGVATKVTSGKSVALDQSNNIYVTGHTDGALDGQPIISTTEAFIVKYDSSGSKLWTRLYSGGAGMSLFGVAIAIDTANNLYLGSTFQRSPQSFPRVIKCNSNGIPQWTQQINPGLASASAYDIKADASGNVYLTGTTSGGLDGNAMTGTADFFITKYDSPGNKLWTRQMGAVGRSTGGYGVTTDSSSNVYVVGHTMGGLDGNTLIGFGDAFVSKYNSLGVKDWTRQFGVASKVAQAQKVSSDPLNNIYVTGYTNGGLDGNTLIGTSDAFITKFNSNGVKQ